MDEEQVFFRQSGITVTNARFIVGSQTFAMRNITSVRSERGADSSAVEGWFMAIGLVLAFIGFLGPGGVATGIIGVIAFAAGFYAVWSKKPVLVVLLTTSAGETKAYQSRDRQFISDLVEALNKSIVARG